MTAAPTEQPSVTTTVVGNVLLITLDRPHVRNAIDLPTAEALALALDRLDDDPEMRCGALVSTGPVFCAGMDLKAVAAGGPRPNTRSRGGLGIASRPPETPLVVGVQGAALGGGFELALCADLIVAAEDAVFGLPEVARGQVAGGGGAVRLPRRLPFHLAAEILLTGKRLDAARAEQLGLVSAVVPREELTQRTVELAEQIASAGPLAVRATKRLMYATLSWSHDEAMQQQESIVDPVRHSRDAAEGARAFAEKRRPTWQGE